MLRVDLLWHPPGNTNVHTMTLGRLGALGSSWHPSPVLAFLVNATAAGSTTGLTDMQLRFTSESGSWQVDDVYVDPFKRG